MMLIERNMIIPDTEEQHFEPVDEDSPSFGLELEVALNTISPDHVCRAMMDRAGIDTAEHDMQDNINHWNKVTKTSAWRLVHDASISCSTSLKLTHLKGYEIVSPVLRGSKGMDQVKRVFSSLQMFDPVVNQSMGLHVHIDASHLTDELLQDLGLVCQAACLYEPLVDACIMPPHRRTASPQSDLYFQSNRDSVAKQLGYLEYNEDCHKALGASPTIDSLINLMNGHEHKNYKLNLQNLKTSHASMFKWLLPWGIMPLPPPRNTMEFRQHPATTHFPDVQAWVQFCMAFATLPRRRKITRPLLYFDSTVVPMKHQLCHLFQHLIPNDKGLQSHFRTILEQQYRD